MMKKTRVHIVGGGVAGMYAALAYVDNNHIVTLYEKNLLGKDLTTNNFGQLHSGAIYSTILPHISRHCVSNRQHISDLQDTHDNSRRAVCYFYDKKTLLNYQKLWDEFGIGWSAASTEDVNDLRKLGHVNFEMATIIDDTPLNAETIIYKLRHQLLERGVEIKEHTDVSLEMSSSGRVQLVSQESTANDTFVIAAGSSTKDILNYLHISNPLEESYLLWATYPAAISDRIIYELGKDLLATCPIPHLNITNFALPGRMTEQDHTETEVHKRRELLSASISSHYNKNIVDTSKLIFKVSKVLQLPPESQPANPLDAVIDLANATGDWDRIDNLKITLAGKVTTSHSIYDQVKALKHGRQS